MKSVSEVFNYYGSTFKLEDLKSIPLHQLEKFSFCPGHLFYFTTYNQQLTPMKRAGEIVEKEFIEKYRAKGLESFLIYSFTDSARVEHYKNLWNRLKVARFEPDKMQIASELTSSISLDYFVSLRPATLLNYISATYDIFNRLPDHYWSNLQETNFIFFQRALLSSSFSVYFALVNGYTDFKFLQDIFCATALFDHSMAEEGISFHMLQACEAERKNASGIKKLQELAVSLNEIQTFINHPLNSFEMGNRFRKSFHAPEILDLVKFHHEKRDGSGFPGKYKYSALSIWETLSSLNDYLFPFQEVVFSPGDGDKYLLQLFTDLKVNSLRYTLPIAQLVRVIEARLNTARVGKEAG